MTDENQVKYISYSASNTLLGCERKYWFEKVVKQAYDADYSDDKEALCVGKAYHQTLELSKHSSKNYSDELLNKAIKENNLSDHHRYIVFASLIAYYKLRRGSALQCIACEIKVGNEQFVGYIDAVLVDSYGNWWICDLKTSGQIQEGMFARLTMDTQLNLYAYFASQVAEQLNLSMDQFMGVRYCVVGKSRMKVKPTESLIEFATRANVTCYDIEIEKQDMQPVAAFNSMMRLLDRANALTEVEIVPNRNNCIQYSSPCPYWSQCHNGKTYSACCEAVKSFDQNSINDRSRIPAVTVVENDLDILA
jgi:hypothetical protein